MELKGSDRDGLESAVATAGVVAWVGLAVSAQISGSASVLE
jgi:hypothetical protein